MSVPQKLVLVVVVALLLRACAAGDGDIDPGPVDSPFPETGFYALVISETRDGHPWEQAKIDGELRSYLSQKGVAWLATDDDRDVASDGPTWRDAIAWANRNQRELPWMVARYKRRAYEGPIPGDDAEQLAESVLTILRDLSGEGEG